MAVDAVILDMDGVLIDSEDYFRDEMTKYFIHHGVSSDYEFSQLYGKSLREIFRELKPLMDEKMSFQEFWEDYRNVPIKIYEEKCSLRKHMRKILEKISKTDYSLVLCTSSGHEIIDLIFERFNLDKYFDFKVSVEDIDGKGKPEPKIYEKAAERANAMPEKCLVVEDADKGIESGKRAGMKVVGLKGTAGQSLEKADIVAEDGQELNKVLSNKLGLS